MEEVEESLDLDVAGEWVKALDGFAKRKCSFYFEFCFKERCTAVCLTFRLMFARLLNTIVSFPVHKHFHCDSRYGNKIKHLDHLLY